MGAILGLWRWDGAALNAAELQPAQQLLQQESGTPVRMHCQEGLALLHAQSHSADDAAEQPWRLPGGLLLADARLDDAGAVMRQLALPAAQDPRWADSRVLAHAWQAWSDAAPRHAPGAYVGAWWDAGDKSLSLFRDSMGERALYYALTPGQIAFASHLPHLLKLPAVPREPNLEFLAGALMRRFLDGPHTAWRRVFRLLPGEVLRLDGRGDTRSMQPYDWRCIEPVQLAGPQEYAEGLREQLRRAVRRRLHSSAGVASFLSSGLDSSAVSAVAAQELARSGQNLSSYTWAPRPGPQRYRLPRRHLDEAPLARAVASMYPNIRHQLCAPQPGGLCQFMEQQLALHQQPVFNLIANKWAARVLADAQQHGADLLLTGLAGNAAFSAATSPNIWPWLWQLRWGRAWQDTQGLARERGISHGGALARGLLGPLRAYRGAFRFAARSTAATLNLLTTTSFARADWLLATGVPQRFCERTAVLKWRLGVAEAPSLANRWRFATHSAWLANEWHQRMEVATGVVARDPTLDRELVAFVLGSPTAQLREGGRSRALAKTAMRGLLPNALIDCPTRGLPNHDWAAQLQADLSSIRERIEGMPRAVAEIIDQTKMRTACELIASDSALTVTQMGALYSDFTMTLEIAAFLEQSLH